MDRVYLSTVTPVYRGEPYLRRLVDEIGEVRAALERDRLPVEIVEAIFVDDASADGSAGVLAELAAAHDWVKVVTLSRNFGQHPATVAGVLHSSGDWVATLDEDLQHRPRFVVDLLAVAASESHDLVYAQPRGAVHPGFLRDAASRLYKAIMSWAAANPRIRRFNSFRMIRGSIARAAASVSSRSTYFDVALCWFTDRVTSLPLPLRELRADERDRGGYDVRALLHHARQMLVSSEIKPLRVGGAIGVAALGLSVAGGAATLLVKLLYPEVIEVRGWTSLFLAVTFFGGLLSLLSGIALEYLSDLHLQALGRPAFFVVDRGKDPLLRPLCERVGEPAVER
jgi:glycosyltransferase involved in cell wall biosynthesis